jgi:subtilisin-like proprotein convertase family protein
MSIKPTNIGALAQGSVTNADFRGKAPAARLYSVAALDNSGTLDISDYYLQTAPALTNALISNNSWTYVGDNSYDLAAAGYDAAVRDALPTVTGSQPVLFVFAAGNDGGGDDNGGSGNPDTILSPGTAKDVITVGALEQDRNITNTYTPLNQSNQVAAWKAGTSSSFEVASYSARGNVGIGMEGTAGRFKPDVVAPGSFVVSTRSEQWDQAAYYDPTNDNITELPDFVDPLSTSDPNSASFFVYGNAAVVAIQLQPIATATSSLTNNLSIYVWPGTDPLTAPPMIFTSTNFVSLPAVPNGTSWSCAVSNPNPTRISYNLVVDVLTTNDLGNYFTVLSNLNNTIGPWYRYESGTSMAAPAVSGSLALIQDYFTNTLQATPSPALLKAMLINGARAVGPYNFTVTNRINFQGWGLANVPNSVRPDLTTNLNTGCSALVLDQSPASSLATGDSRSYLVTVTNTAAQPLPLRVTLAWTDPPGNPAAAIKLVNNLILVVSNNVTGSVYFGNDIPSSSTFNSAWDTNGAPNLDTINNIENVFLPSSDGSNYTVTVIGRSVNVNAVTAQTNNVVQDYALVISCGDTADGVTNAFIVTAPNPPVSNPTGDQQVTVVGIDVNGMATNTAATGGVFLNQLAGANTPLLGTNQVDAVSNYNTNTGTAVVTLGMTNQWHFYVVQNMTGFTNAAFVTFLPDTLSMPRMGVYADATQNPTTPEADIDLYVATGTGAAGLTNLDPVVISNCVNGVNGNAASLGGGGTEFVAFTDSQPNQVYYVGVKSETALAGEYGFLPVFSQLPFSTTQNGIETVNGLLLPMLVPDGSPAHPGTRYIFALAIQPIQVASVTVSNQIVHENFGDLVGTLSHNGKGVVLNNHDSPATPLPPGPYDFLYDDSLTAGTGSQHTDGPGSLQEFQGQSGVGPWILTEVDNALTATGAVTGLTLTIAPHNSLQDVVTVTLPPGGYFYSFIDVPVGATNLSFFATNISNTTLGTSLGSTLDPANPGVLYEKLGEQPAPPPTPLTNYDKSAPFNNGTPPTAFISVGRSDVPPIEPGRYYVTIWNNSLVDRQTFQIQAVLGIGQVQPVNFTPTGPVPLLDDAVSYAYITNYPGPNATNETIASIAVGIRVDHPRISDLVFTLISPDGTRYLLMQNRGNTSTNGAGATVYSTNTVNVVASGNNASATNVIDLGETQGTLPISYNFYTVPDQMTVYYGTNLVPANLIYNSGLVGGSSNITVSFPPLSATGISSNLTIVMNQFGNPSATGDLWTYSAGGVSTKFYYLTFTDDTNITTPPIPSPMTPIKFAPTPFVPGFSGGTNVFADGFEGTATTYLAGQGFNTWTVLTNQVSVVTDPVNAIQGNNFLALANGVISNTLPTVAGQTYTLSFAYRGPFDVAFYRAEGNANDSIYGNNGTAVGGVTYTAGEVGQAFGFNGSSSYVALPASPELNNIGVNGSGFTIEGWIKAPNTAFNTGPILEWDSATVDGVQFWVQANEQLYANIWDTSRNFHNFWTATGVLNPNAFQHVALTYDKLSGNAIIYVNGGVSASKNIGNITPQTSYAFPRIGLRNANNIGVAYFTGLVDELSVYERALSPSEIEAIYTLGGAGKFNPAVVSPQNLAEATVSLQGNNPATFFGANTNWQTYTTTFVATQNGTPLVFTGIEPGVLLDAVSLSQPAAGNNLYYQPEQDLTPLVGTSAYGLWQLEIQDDRVGATNNVVLDSWQLQFVFDNTNAASNVLIPGTEICNTAPANGILWYQVNVPLNAAFATNTLISADSQVNLLINTNSPDISGATTVVPLSTSGTNILSTTNGTPLLIPGSTYYLGVQNPGGVPVNTCIEVDFGLLPTAFAYTEPAQLVTGTSAQLNGFATPNGYPANAWFQWGTNTLYGNSSPPTAVGNGYNVAYVVYTVPTVTNVPYHFRLVVSNALGVVYGFDQILDEANVIVWGANNAGQLNAPTNKNVTAIAGAYDHNLALTTNGQVIAWGDNTFGQATVPAVFSNQVTAAVAGGEYYSLALKSDGTVSSWGANFFNETNVPAGLSNVVTIAGGQYSSLALQNNGSVVAWGAETIFPVLTNVPAGASNTVAVAGGGYHSLALRNDGTVSAWGYDNATNVPVGLTNVVAIAAGSFHSLALKYNGTVVAWGDGTDGQTNVPPGLTNVVAIAAGGFHNLALKADGTVVTWGDNSAGQSSVPVGLTNVVAVSAGYFHSLALTPTLVTNGIILPLVPGVPQTNSILPGYITYYQVNVPTNADFATNTLLFASGPLNVWFSTNTPPVLSGANATLLMAGVTNLTQSVLGTNTLPALVPGSTYYLGVQNTNNITVNYGIEVAFHLVTIVIPPPFTNVIPISSIIHTNGGFLLTWFAPSNDLFQVQWSSNLPPVWQTFTNIVSYNTNYPASATNAQFNFFDDGSQAPFVGPTRFYRLVQLGSLLNLSNSVPLTANVAPGSTAYYSITVPSSADFATNTLASSTAPVNLLFNQNGLPTGTNSGGYTLLVNVTGGISILGASTTPPLVPGTTYYLGVQNTNSFTVQFTLGVNFHLTATAITNYPISGVTFTNISGINGILFTWKAPTNYQFQIQWTTSLSLAPVSWTTVPGVVPMLVSVTGTTGTYQWFVDFSLTGGFGTQKFYRLIAYPPGVPLPSLLVISSAKILPGGVIQLQWAGATNYVYDVLWTTNVALARSSWNVLSNLVPPTLVYSAGTFTFMTNAVTLTGGASGAFFQVLQLP